MMSLVAVRLPNECARQATFSSHEGVRRRHMQPQSPRTRAACSLLSASRSSDSC